MSGSQFSSHGPARRHRGCNRQGAGAGVADDRGYDDVWNRNLGFDAAVAVGREHREDAGGATLAPIRRYEL